jgi:hypothetical protein
MRKPSIFVVAFLLLIVGASGSIYYALYAWNNRPGFALTATSPDQSYTVELKEHVKDLSATSSGEVIHTVWMNVFRGNQPILKDVALYGGDSYDDRFFDLFPEYNWASNSIIHFGSKNNDSPSLYDEVTIWNETNRAVSYLRVVVEKNEMFLLFDIQPKSSVRLLTHAQTNQGRDYSWIGVEGKLDNKDIPHYGLNFRVLDLNKNPAHYYIIIKNEGLTICSKEFEGFKYNNAGVETRVTEAGDCIPQ